MKKTFSVLILAINLLGLNHIQAQQTEPFIIPANAYALTSSTGTFTDIAENPATVKFASLPGNTALLNGFFVNAAPSDPTAAANFVTHTADKTKTDPGFELGFTFKFCGKPMTHFTVCASGGIHFGATKDIPQAQSSAWYTNSQDYQNLVTLTVWDTAGSQNPMRPVAGKTPAMYLIEGEAGQKVLTVQYHYTVNGDEWTYQLKAHEATGRIEFIAGDLKTQNLGDKQYRIFFGLVENGLSNLSITDDPLKTLNLIYSGSAHKVGFNQTSANGWESFSSHTADAIGNGMVINTQTKPESGRTLAFSLTDCATPADGLSQEAYILETTAISKTAFSGKISYNKDKLTADLLTKTGTIVAVLSTTEIPAKLLADGIWHRQGDQVGDGRVLLNAKPGYRLYNGSISGNIVPLDLKADGLTAGTPYYIHIYAMSYNCLGAPVYSDLCHTFSFTSSIDLPKKLSADAPTISSVPVTVQSAGEGFGLVLLKSPNTNSVALSGKLSIGQKFGEAEVMNIISSSDETRCDIPFAAGEGAYILAVSAKDLESESPVYAADFLSIPVRAAYNGLPKFENFANESFTYGSPTEYKRLPFGWSRETELPEDDRGRAFGLGRINDGDAICLVSSFPDSPLWVDVITPAFVCPKNKIQVTYHTSYLKNSQTGDAGHYAPGASDLVRIEYSINGGDWQEALALNGHDDNFPKTDEQGRYPISVSIAKIPTKAMMRLRYSYQSPNSEARIHNRIHAVEIVEGKDCEAPHSVTFVDSLATNAGLTLRWLDDNYPQAANFVLAYRKMTDDANAWKYRRVRANDNASRDTPIDGDMTDLDAQTLYTAKVAAVCGTRDTSFYSAPLTARTAFGLPYEESMARTGSGSDAQTPFDRGVKTYTGVIGGTLTEATDAGWSQITTSDAYNRATAVSIADFTSNAWLMLPTVYIPENGDFIPKSMQFTLSSFDADKHKGASPNYDDTKLHVLISKNGTFSRANIVKTFNAADLALDNTDFSIDLTEREGLLQAAFVFECPSAYDTTKIETEPWYLEISQLSINYDVDVCFPVSKLHRTLGVNETPLDWEPSPSAVEYGIFWGLNTAEGYTDSAFTKEAYYTITGLNEYTRYKAAVIAYCAEDHSLRSEPATTTFSTLLGCHTPADFSVHNITLTGADFSSTSDQPDYMNLRLVYVWPENSEDIRIFRQQTDTLSLQDSLTPRTAYIAATQAICGTDTSAMSAEIRFVTEAAATEAAAQISALFSVHTQNGRVIIRNPHGALISNVSVYNLNGIKLTDLRADSRDDLTFPTAGHRMLIFVRLQTEKGTAVYKTYLQ